MGNLEDRIRELEDKVSSTDAESALKYVDELILLRGSHHDYIAKGLCYGNIEKYDESLNALTKAIEINPQYGYGWHCLGTVIVKKYGYEKAIEPFLRAAQLEPQNYETWHFLGIALGETKKYHEAITAYRNAVSINSQGETSWHNLGKVLKEINKISEAIEEYRKATKIIPNSQRLWSDLGEMLRIAQKPEEAMDAYKRAVQCDPKVELPWINLVVLAQEKNDFSQAIQIYSTALKIIPESGELWRRLGHMLNYMDKKEKALEAFNSAIHINPKDENAWGMSGIILYLLNRPLESLAFLNNGLINNPRSEFIQFAKTFSLIDLKFEKEFHATIDNIQNRGLRETALAKYYLTKESDISCINSAVTALFETSKPENTELKEIIGALNKYNTQSLKEGIRWYIKKNSFRNLIKILNEDSKSKYNIQSFSCILSALVDYAGLEKEYVKQSQDLFREVLRNNPDTLKSTRTGSKNIVEVIATNVVSNNKYLIKAYRAEDATGRKRLEKEYIITRFVNSKNRLTSEAILIEAPYMLERYLQMPSLEEIEKYAEKEELTKEINNCIHTMTSIHKEVYPVKLSETDFEIKYHDEFYNKKYSIIIEKYDIMGELNRRLVNRVGGDARELIKEYKLLLDKIDIEEYFIHSDSFKSNWLKKGILIDWEKASVGDPMIDLVQLINDVEFTDINKEALITEYMQNKNNNGSAYSNILYSENNNITILPIDYDEEIVAKLHRTNNYTTEQIKEKYHVLSIHNALCQIGSKISQGKIEEAKLYLTQAIQISPPKMREAIINYANSSSLTKILQ